ncbi:hypothetical protein TCAL_00322 [Tigriopus californicus]|uniref:Mannosyltransferase n=1 Tax=Tigriopus californicus TaxID=6832 RepID=A0A553NC80_TIGCA|nr:dol-P-Man:Man(7)GlcNAc(2)-PP-Dol alpha-1,6-mannosyltransferase-like [Tigriopus californicus]TRY63051.1 hypothetical protein TCAL_00322 [Tigriopus californicus]|eukprot:TCALIF_00322-PA protein Name:"Similar to Alg12 Dol-P-Man:Man(7)GlcNAc(2)-PP-Dol alpha-1,6-mannosyltransferase (Mus musculus)" AED:0.05 eAED:0.05 QI:0/0/0/1/1/1/2/0/479
MLGLLENVLPLLLGLFELWMCPLTKVEESFNLQACHDILFHGSNLDRYDHHQFPGVVPRTFLGPLLVSTLSYPLAKLAMIFPFAFDKFACQLIVRGVLSLLVLLSLQRFRRAVSHIFGRQVGVFHSLLTITQFHFMFYSSRTLPNTFALIFVLQALAAWLNKRQFQFIAFSAIAVLIFRGEVVLFLGLYVLMDVAFGKISILRLIAYGVPCLVGCLALTVGVDSFFWQRTLWPEGEVLYYNIILNKSHNWGTLPWAWYFYSAIPRALCCTVPLVPLGLRLDARTIRILFPALGFVILYSFLPHKELRFIIYTFPVLNVAAAVACQRIWRNMSRSWIWKVLALAVFGHFVANAAFSTLMLQVSQSNYPGGQALRLMQSIVPPHQDLAVHMDVFSCQTGISRFLQGHDEHWVYSKTENVTEADLAQFSFLIREVNECSSRLLASFKIIGTVQQYDGISLNYQTWPPIHIKQKPAVYLLERQ